MPNPNCERCHGTGLVTIQIGGDGYGDKCCGVMDCDDQPCTSCTSCTSCCEFETPGIRQYASDSLSGPAKGPLTDEWWREGVREIVRRANAVLPPSKGLAIQVKDHLDGRVTPLSGGVKP